MRLPGKSSSVVCLLSVIAFSGCSASKSASPDSDALSPSATQTTTVRTSNVLTGAAVAGAAVSGSGITGGTTDGAGAVTVSTLNAATYSIDVAASGFVTRNTLLKLPGNDATVSLIANSFDLAAFNEMFRVTALQRWTTAPELRIVSNVLDYADDGATHTALAEALTADEIQSIINDLSYGLPLLTGGTFATFASISKRTVAAGENVTILNQGQITFARCRGVKAVREAAGVGQWQYTSDDTVTGGSICIDRDFELENNPYRRGVRLHEMGHALGAQHVTVRSDVLMNPTIAVNEVTAWDQAAAKIAFRRPTGNKSPDRDPATFSTNRLVTRVMTSDACRVIR